MRINDLIQRARSWARRLKSEAYALYLAMRDPRTPWYARALAFLVVAHTFSPIDLIPDFIPVLGYLDDLLITPLGLWLALRLIPAEVMAEARRQAAEAPPALERYGRIGMALVVFAWMLTLIAVGYLGWRAYRRAAAPAGLPGQTLEGMVAVEAGWFWMGSPDGPPSSRPFHRVYLDRFAIDRLEVSVADFRSYLAAGGEPPQVWAAGAAGDGGELPMTGVLWREADAYCRAIGKRLPTEAEWEKAARGTDGRAYPWGSDWDASLANTGASRIGAPTPVGAYPHGASPYGARDMIGNAAEWVADFFDPGYYARSPQINPLGPSQVLDHGLRGGSWDSPPEQASVFFRDSSHSARPNPRVGFRCAISLPPDSLVRGTNVPIRQQPPLAIMKP